ncbi:MAG: M48 family metallopeptidase [Verrucomicrobiae bacterium]|nr:M48 family metallopeptidase [Verrucomicrobiae bacterium]
MVRGRSRMGCTTRIIIALVIIGFAYVKMRMGSREEVNPYTGDPQRISLSPDQEHALGLQAAGQMEAQHGGPSRDERATARVNAVGLKLVQHIDKLLQPGAKSIKYEFAFHLLADDQLINAFALPGGQVFITEALYGKVQNDDQLAGVLGHEIGHVIARHSNEQMTKNGFLQGIGTAAGVLAGGDDLFSSQQVSGLVSHVLTTKYGRTDELESDEIGARLMLHAGYDPREILGVMEILKQAGGSGGQIEMLSTHPLPESRIERLKNEVLPGLGVSVE